MKSPEIRHVARGHTKNVIAFTGNQKAGKNLRDIGGGGLEFSQHLGGLAFKADLHEDKHLVAKLSGIQLRVIAIDDAGFFQLAHPPQAG